MDMKGMTHSPKAHYIEAERLIAEGEKVVAKIADLALEREAVRANGNNSVEMDLRPRKIAQLTQRMDEQGKKAMGIWAQALVHAQLANVPVIS